MKSEDMPLISVIMCVHSYGHYDELKIAIESILCQTYHRLEYIICDDASDSKTRVILEEYAQADFRIRLIHNEENKGVAASLNRCIHMSEGAYIARMDGDDRSAPTRLEEEYRFLCSHPEYAFVGCNARLMDDSCLWGRRHMPECPAAQDFLQYSPYIHPTVMGRREFFLCDYGYLESGLTWRCEDLELFMRRHSQKQYGYNLQRYLYDYREGIEGYHKRKFRYCLLESLVRLKGYRRLHILRQGGFLYVFKPVFVGLLPKMVYRKWKQHQGRNVSESAAEI